ncbi:SnoaL-like polyketide cyclase [Colletotrichum plurivorum]|uniref:SnoaL-like polyketide cyclase n=1 Tax=Colletotrichum plurivorum TaxID=2175906 RepID=A0A8H6KC02_9PEZI|nr:SnoaL-like polyketide cyclase [Colletotrichum plurivorum]
MSTNPAARYQSFLDALDKSDLAAAGEFLQESIVYNNKTITRDEYLERVAPKPDVRVDGVTANDATQSLLGRRLTRVESVETWSLFLIFFESGKIAKEFEVPSYLSQHLKLPAWPSVIPGTSTKPLTAAELEAAYQTYVYSFNDGTWREQLQLSYDDVVSGNGNASSRDATINLLERLVRPAIRGLEYGVEHLVADVEKQQVGVRISLSGVPENENLSPDGGSVKLYELALYGFKDGRISWFWATPDFDVSPPQQ